MQLTRRAWLAMLGAASTLRGAARLARFPYVANVRRDRATITWTTLDPGAGSVEFAPDDSFSLRSAAGSEEFTSARTGLGYSYHQFRADLNGLRPDTEYRYRVAVDGAVLDSGPLLRFRTPGSGPLKFVAVGDTGQDTAVQNEIALLMAEENPALVIHTGDVVYPVGGWTEYQDFYFTPYEDLARRAPFYLSLGNHDVMTGSGDPYLSLHAHPSDGVPATDRGRYYSFDWGNVHFISLDSNAPLIPGEAAMARMLQWLDNDLAASRQFWRIAYFHHPPYASGFNEKDPLSEQVRQRIVPILERHGVELVLTGHEHSYQRTPPMRGGAPATDGPGTVYITTGGGGAGLFDPPPRPFHASRQRAHHYLRITADDARLIVEAIGQDRRLLEYLRLDPQPIYTATVNSASYTVAVAPGGLASIFGQYLATREQAAAAIPLPTDLGGTKVTLDGRPLPLFYVSSTQINVQLPFDVQGLASLRVTRTDSALADAFANVSEAAPAIFQVRAGASMVPAIVHPNGRLVTDAEPARPGEFVVLYLTGLGRVAGSISLGAPAPGSPPLRVHAPCEVRIGNMSVEPTFAGLAPGFAGLNQVNVQIPTELPAGHHPLEVIAQGARSNRVTIAVG